MSIGAWMPAVTSAVADEQEGPEGEQRCAVRMRTGRNEAVGEPEG